MHAAKAAAAAPPLQQVIQEACRKAGKGEHAARQAFVPRTSYHTRTWPPGKHEGEHKNISLKSYRKKTYEPHWASKQTGQASKLWLVVLQGSSALSLVLFALSEDGVA